MLTISVSTKFSLTKKRFGVICFQTEEIGSLGSFTGWRLVVSGPKVSPATLPAVTHLSPLMHQLKIVWPHRMKQRKEEHLSEGTLTDLLQRSITHSGE